MVWPFGRGRPRRDRELLVQGRLAEETEMVPPSIEEGRGDGRDEVVEEGGAAACTCSAVRARSGRTAAITARLPASGTVTTSTARV